MIGLGADVGGWVGGGVRGEWGGGSEVEEVVSPFRKSTARGRDISETEKCAANEPMT